MFSLIIAWGCSRCRQSSHAVARVCFRDPALLVPQCLSAALELAAAMGVIFVISSVLLGLLVWRRAGAARPTGMQ
ncbi:MAG: hypothetical protein R3E68_13150 [Burkholderiaceae bacterium]